WSTPWRSEPRRNALTWGALRLSSRASQVRAISGSSCWPRRTAPRARRTTTRAARSCGAYAVQWAERDRKAVVGERQRHIAHRRHVVPGDGPLEVPQECADHELGLQAREDHAQALVYPTAERLPREPVRLVLATLR